jgi:hypothetical protein
MEEISEQVQGLQVSRSLESNSSTDPGPMNHLPRLPPLDPSEQINSVHFYINGQPSDPATRDVTSFSARPIDQEVTSNECSKVTESTVPDIDVHEVVNENCHDSSYTSSAFLEAIEMQAQIQQEEGSDNILVYQRLSELAQSQMLEN